MRVTRPVFQFPSTMILHCGLWLMFVGCVWTEHSYDYGIDQALKEMGIRYSSWPSFLNTLRRRRDTKPGMGLSEGGGVIQTTQVSVPEVVKQAQQQPENIKEETAKVPANETPAPNVEKLNATQEKVKANEMDSSKNATLVAKQLDLRDPGVLMRGVIVFGGFTLLAVAYYIFYRRKSNKNENSNAHNITDANQFRYGVLHSDDQRDNLELSRVPLTMESDDDDDEDMEIFDIGQKKKSLVYVDLKGNDEDVVFQKSTESNQDNNLLLDLEDASTDPILNWNNGNANKSLM